MAIGWCHPMPVPAGDYGETYEYYPVEAGYKHASPEACEARRDQKFGLRIHRGALEIRKKVP